MVSSPCWGNSVLHLVPACCLPRLLYGSDSLLLKVGISVPAYISAFISNSVTPKYFYCKILAWSKLGNAWSLWYLSSSQSSAFILPALDRVHRYNLQISFWGEEEWGVKWRFRQWPTRNPCRKPIAEQGLKTFWFLAGAQQTHRPEILTYQPVGRFSLCGYVFSNCDRLLFGRGVASFWVHGIQYSFLAHFFTTWTGSRVVTIPMT